MNRGRFGRMELPAVPDIPQPGETNAASENPRPVYADPEQVGPSWYDEDTYEPRDFGVGWDLSFGCRVTFRFDGPDLGVSVSTSDGDRRNGGTIRTVTREQVAAFARQLLKLVGAQESEGGEPE